MSLFVILLFAILLVLQGSLVSFPLVFVFLQNYAIKQRNVWIFPLAFTLGLILEALYLRTPGILSLFFLLFLFAIFTYERKFEIDNPTFIFISSFLGSMVLFTLLAEPQILLKSFLTSVFALLLFKTW